MRISRPATFRKSSRCYRARARCCLARGQRPLNIFERAIAMVTTRCATATADREIQPDVSHSRDETRPRAVRAAVSAHHQIAESGDGSYNPRKSPAFARLRWWRNLTVREGITGSARWISCSFAEDFTARKGQAGSTQALLEVRTGFSSQ